MESELSYWWETYKEASISLNTKDILTRLKVGREKISELKDNSKEMPPNADQRQRYKYVSQV